MIKLSTTKAGLLIEREHETGGGSSGLSTRKEAVLGRITQRRYTLRYHLRSQLRQKLARQ